MMEMFDLDGNIYAEYDLRPRWDTNTNVQICNATCYGLLDPCESSTLREIFHLQCTDVGDQFLDIGIGYCRDIDDAKPNGYHKRLASRSICGQYCQLRETCIGYAWSHDNICYLYFQDFVTRYWQDAEIYEHYHMIPEGWFEFLPQGSAGSVQIDRTDGNPTRRCYARMREDMTGSWEAIQEAEERARQEQEEADRLAAIERARETIGFATPTDPNQPDVCTTFREIELANLARGSRVRANPPGDIRSAWVLCDGNLDRNWHSDDDLPNSTPQELVITLPGNDFSGNDKKCIASIKLFWRNVYTARAYTVQSSLDGHRYTDDLLLNRAKNLPAELGRIDEFEFGLHDARFVKLTLTEKQRNYTLDYDLLEVEIFGTPHGKCNDTFRHQPPLNFTAEYEFAQARMPVTDGGEEHGDQFAAEAGSIHVEEAYVAEALCGFDDGRPIDANGTDRCGALQRPQIALMCMTLVNAPDDRAPPMDAGPKNLLDYLGLEWEMREAILAQPCAGWDMIMVSEREICWGEIENT
eukprot:SAG31_NODE_6511_length_1991_cov_1.470402_2_plen_524_part_01